MARVYKRGGVWWMDFERHSVRTQKSLRVAVAAMTKTQARDLMLEKIRKAAHAEVFGAAPEATAFARFADEWLEKDSTT